MVWCRRVVRARVCLVEQQLLLDTALLDERRRERADEADATDGVGCVWDTSVSEELFECDDEARPCVSSCDLEQCANIAKGSCSG